MAMNPLRAALRAPVRRIAAGVAALVASAGLTVASAGTAQAATPCTAVSATVAGGWTIQGRLCVPEGATTVALLQSGATYGSGYWDFGYQPQTYSFVDYASAHGLATLNIDRLGVGASSHPPAEAVTTLSEAAVAHQLVQGLRSGEFGPSFAHVALAGHSLGSVISVMEASTYHDVDAVLLTGLTHSYGTAFLTDFEASLRPAALAYPQRFGSLPLGYLTTAPGGNDASYYRPNADPAVMAYDEAHKETMTDGEDLTLPTGIVGTLGITAPVLSMVGQYDVEMCGLVQDCSNPLSLMGLEPAFYPAAKSFQLKVVPDAAHNLNLQRNAPTTFAEMTDWITTHANT